MSKNKYALIREMLGDNISELIAEDLKETYDELLKELNQTVNDEFKAPMFSYEKEVDEIMSEWKRQICENSSGLCSGNHKKRMEFYKILYQNLN